MLAKLIAIEGPDKAGKATQTKLLAHVLRRYGDRVKLVEVPWNDRFTHKLIYKLLRSGVAKRYTNTFQFIQFLNKFLFQVTYLVWLMLTCKYVVLDRWHLSSIVYGDASGANRYFTRFLQLFLIEPNTTIVLHGRSFRRSTTVDDSYEKDSELQAVVKQGYYDWVMTHDDSYVLVNNSSSVDDVHDLIMAALFWLKKTDADDQYDIEEDEDGFSV